MLKPDVIFHGGSIPKAVTAEAEATVDSASALLVLGTTLTTWSSFRLVRQASAAGKPIAIVNFGPTRGDSLLPAPLKLETSTSAALHGALGQLLR
jgi:NAD-dependent SIR2 family protein deacetylase